MKNVGIIGCGWLGEKIAEALFPKYSIYTTTKSEQKAGWLKAKGFNPTVVSFSEEPNRFPRLWKDVKDLDILIITVPLSGKNISSDHLSVKIKSLSQFIGRFKGPMYFMSSTSVYPDVPEQFSESYLPPESVLPERLIRELYPQVNILRLAGLMGADRLLMNYRIPDMNLPVNHIHYSDVCAVIERMIERGTESQLYNVVAPLHPSKEEVIKAQKSIAYTGMSLAEGRIISCDKLVADLQFIFTYPDPRTFHN